MEGFDASNENVEVELQRQQFVKEKNDIVCGFLKEKEIIEIMHKEEVDNLVARHEQETELMRKEFQLEKQDLLQGFQKQQVENVNEFKRERENYEGKTARDFQSRERNLEMKYKEEKLKMRREYEEIIAEKNEEIKMIRRELLRVEHQENLSVRHSPESDVYITKIEHNEELKRLAEKFNVEKLELVREFHRDKAKLVQVFSNQAERMNSNFDHVKQRMQEDQEKELEFKLEITEKLLSEKFELEKKRMLHQFEREMKELQESLEFGYNETLLEKNQTIDDLEQEKRRLLNALHTERFSLARIYNREMSLLTKSDQITKEDVEVALIDETAKLKQQYEDELNKMEQQHRQKIEVIKRKQRPFRESELEHRKEIEKLKKDFENEKGRLEAEFRKEQFNLLKSFEFEKNDLQQEYEGVINEKELEMQQRESDMRQLYEEELDRLKSIVAKQREELETSKQKLTDLADQTEEFLSEKNRIEEKFLKENNHRQSLQQTMEANIKTYERNMKEVEAFHKRELAQLRKEKEQLQKIESEKKDLQKEVDALKVKLEEAQIASEKEAEVGSSFVAEPTVTVDGEAYKEIEGIRVDVKSTPTETRDETLKSEKEEMNDFLRKIRERLRKCMIKGKEPKTLEEFEMSYKQMKDAINQEIVEIDKICGSKENGEHDITILFPEEPTFSLKDQMQAVDDLLGEENTKGNIDKSTKEKINLQVKGMLKKVHRSHELEKLKLKKEQQHEFGNVLKELADEKAAKVQEPVKDLRHLQDTNERGDRSPMCAEIKATKDRGTSTDGLHQTRNDKTSMSSLYMVDELRRENEGLRRSFDELENVFTKDKKELTEKLQTQHHDFVMSAEGEIIEKLLKQKSSLEEALNTERFYLSRLYYQEMKDELGDILSRRTEKLKREFNGEKMNLIFKYERDITDLQKLLSEKAELEMRLLQERNDVTAKLLAAHKKASPEKSRRERLKEKERLERDKENLEIAIPLKKEIAALQNKRHQEHEKAAANLKEAIDLIMDVMASAPLTTPEDVKPFDSLSFLSQDTVRSNEVSPAGKVNENGFKTRTQASLSRNEIHNRDELGKALEKLVDTVVSEDEEFTYESETTSGASSDLESEDSGTGALNGDIDEGAYSGPESNDDENTLNIKKKELEFTFNLERFNLGRLYYGEYKDSLRKAMKKLEQAKEALRSKRKDLEKEMRNGIELVVSRTHFGEVSTQASKRDRGTQTVKGYMFEKSSEDLVDGQGLYKVKTTEVTMEPPDEDDSRRTDFRENMEGKQEDKPDNKEQEKEKGKPELLSSHTKDCSRQEESQVENGERDSPATGKRDLEGKGSPTPEEDKCSSDDLNTSDGTNLSRESKYPAVGQDLDTITEEQEEDGGYAGEAHLQDSEIEDLLSAEKKRDRDEGIKNDDVPQEQMEIQKPTEEATPISSKPKEHQGDEKKEKGKGDDSAITNIGKTVEKLDDEKGTDADDGISSKEGISEKAKEVKDKSADGKEDKDTKGSPIAETDVVGDEDMSTIQNTSQAEPYNEMKRYKEDQSGDEGGDRNAEQEIPVEIDGEPGIPDADEKITSLKLKTDKESPEASISQEDEKSDGDLIEGQSTEEKEKKPKKKQKGIANVIKGDSSEETDHLDGILTGGINGHPREKDEESSPEGHTSEGEKNVEVNEKPKEKKKRKKGRGRKAGKHSKEDEKEDKVEETDEEDHVNVKGRESPISNQDLIEELTENNKILQDKFSLLCELVGKGFVDEIPELTDENYRICPDKPLDSVHELYTEKEQLANEIQKIDLQIKELAESGSDTIKELNEDLDKKELELMHSLEETEKHLKRDEDKKLVEHLLKEKEDVCTKLDEINNILNEKKGEMEDLRSHDGHTVPGLMYRKDVLRDDLTEKTRELNSSRKLLETASQESEKEKQHLENSINSLNVQFAALQEFTNSSHGNSHLRARPMNKWVPPEIEHLLNSKADAEHEIGELDKKIEKAENENNKYHRVLEEQTDRLKPFYRKKARLEKALKFVNQPSDGTEDLPTRTVVEITDGADDAGEKTQDELLMDGNKVNVPDQYISKNQRKMELEYQIEELNAAIRTIGIPFGLDCELAEEIPTVEKLQMIHEAKTKKEEDLQVLEAEIIDEQNNLRKGSSVDPEQLIEKFKQNEKLKKNIAKYLDSSKLAEGEHNDVKQLQSIVSSKDSLEEQAHLLDRQIWQEQSNFLEAFQFKRTGKVNADCGSKIKELLDTKDKLVEDLDNTNEKILKNVSTGGLMGTHAQGLEECVERKVKLEEEIARLQDHIADEPGRAAESLVNIIEKKSDVSKDLKGAKRKDADELSRVQIESIDDYCRYDPKEVNDTFTHAISTLGKESAPIIGWEELRQKQHEMEVVLKEKAECLIRANREGKDPSSDEEVVESVIRDKISVDKKLQEVLEENNSKEAVFPPQEMKENESNQRLQMADVNDEREEMEDNLSMNEYQLNTLLQSAGLIDNDVQKLESLVVEKVKLEGELEKYQLLQDLFLKKKYLQQKLCNEQQQSDECQRNEELRSELEKLNALIDRRENDVEKIKTKKNVTKEKVKHLEDEKEKLNNKLKPLTESIIKLAGEVQVRLEDAKKKLNEHEKCAVEERQALQNELEALQDEIDRWSKEEKEVDRELESRKNGLSERNGNLLDLEKLLIEKESLREYLTEIDATLDKTEMDTVEQANVTNAQELSERKKELERKLEEIRNKKLKMDVEFETDEISEAMKELFQTMENLEVREREVSDQIRESGILGKLAERRKNGENKVSRFFIYGILEAMGRDEKTVTELLKEKEELKNAAQKERDNVNEEMALLKSKVGKDLANALIPASIKAQTDKESDSLSAIDEIESRELTISDLLKDFEVDNKQLRLINDELSSELESLKNKIGEELANELGQYLPDKHSPFSDVVSVVQQDEKTLEDILQEQNEKMLAIEDSVGKDLLSSILWMKDNPRRVDDVDTPRMLMTPSIMEEFDEDLENVIAVYEKELNSLSCTNDLLKERLGEVLLQDILSLSKNTEKPVLAYGTAADPYSDGTVNEHELCTLNKDKDVSEFNADQGAVKLPEEEINGINVKTTDPETGGREEDGIEHQDELRRGSTLKDSKDVKLMPRHQQERQGEVKMRGSDLRRGSGPFSSYVENKTPPKLYYMCLPHFTYPHEQNVSASADEENVQGYLRAPKIMEASGKTLGDVIAQYENDLQQISKDLNPESYVRDSETSTDVEDAISSPTRQRRTSATPLSTVDTSDGTIPNDIVEIDMKLQGIVETQDKNLGMLQLLKERLGEDLVDALITETDHPIEDDVQTNGKVDALKIPENIECGGTTRKELVGEPPDKDASTEMGKHSSDHVRPRKISKASIDKPKGESTERKEEKASVTKMKAPNIVLENKTTLGDVIASYERVLDSLQSKLGPSLTRTLVTMQDPTALEREDAHNKEKARKTEEKTSDQYDVKEHEKQTVDEQAKAISEKIMETLPECGTGTGERTTQTSLRAPDIMETSGKTLETIIEDYEKLIEIELKQMENEVTTLKERLGSELYKSIINTKNRGDDVAVSDRAVTFPNANETYYVNPEALKSESVEGEVGVSSFDLKAKSLLEQKGMTVEDILRSYEKQLEALSKLVPNEDGKSDSIADLVSSYQDKIDDLESENKTLSDRISKLSERIGPDLVGKLECMEDEDYDVRANDGLNAPIVMRKEDKTLENVVRNYEKELSVLRNMLPTESEEMSSISDIVKEYEDKIDDLKNRNNGLQKEHDRLVGKIGNDLVEDILSLKLTEAETERGGLAHSEVSEKEGNNNLRESGRLNAPFIMDKEDSTLEHVLETYEKALGILPCSRCEDNRFGINQIRSLEELERENKIFRDALGGGLAANLIARADEGVPEKGELKVSSKEDDNGENQLPHQEQKENEAPFSKDERNQLTALKVMKEEDTTIEKILKSYENEIEALHKLFPSETNEASSVSDLVKDYEDRIEELENEKATLLDLLGELTNTIGPGLMDELQRLNTSDNGREETQLGGEKCTDLAAPKMIRSEDRTLEEVLKIYENELAALRELTQNHGDMASSLSDIIKSYEDKLKDRAEEITIIENKFLELESKIGTDLVDELGKLEIRKAEKDNTFLKASEKGDRIGKKEAVKLRAPDVMIEKKLPLEDILAIYEEDLCSLKRENKIYQEGLGQSIAEELLELAKKEESSRSENFDQKGSNTEEDSELNTTLKESIRDNATSAMKTEEEGYELVKQPSKQDAACAVKGDVPSGTGGLQAMNLLREEGNNIERILNIYEKEIQALRRLASEGTGEKMSVSDLIRDYEDKISDLETKNSVSKEKLNRLEKRVGQDLFYGLENMKSGEKSQGDEKYDAGKKSDLEALNMVISEDRNLENVLKSYEKELSALRKLLPIQNDEGRSMSGIVKEYEDKMEEMRRENERFESELKVLEDKIGANLLGDIKTTSPSDADSGENEGGPDILGELQAPTIMKDNDLTLENVIASYEKDIEDLSSENKALKDNLGPGLAQMLLSSAGKKERLAVTGYFAPTDTCKVDDKVITEEGESEKHDFEAEDKQDASDIRGRPLDRNNNNGIKLGTDLPPRVFKAESLIKDEGKTIENILRDYEKQLEVLTETDPDNKEEFISKPMTKYEDVIEGLENENNNLVKRLENLEKTIGISLLNAVEKIGLEETEKLKDNCDQEMDDNLMVPEIMKKEGRTLENVIKAYERELDVLRDFIPREDGNRGAITDVVKDYEDKINKLKRENKQLTVDLGSLEEKIGRDLVNDIKMLEGTVIVETEAKELKAGESQKNLKVTKIMEVKRSALEDVLQTYEDALGTFLSDASNFIDGPEGIVYDQSSTMNELKEENDILKRTVGPALSQKLINIGKGGAEATEGEKKVSENDTNVEYELDGITELETGVKQQSPAQNKKEEFKVVSLVREEGRTIENVLKTYEEELETLKSVVLDDTGQAAETFLDLIRKYEAEKEKLERTNKSLLEKQEFLEKHIGPDLINDVENKRNVPLRDNRSDINALALMQEEERTLETVIRCYEKELDALRKMNVSQKKEGDVSISDLISGYEGKLDDLKNENKLLKYDLHKMKDKLGSNLAEHIKGLDDKAESEAEAEDKEERMASYGSLEADNKAADGTHGEELQEVVGEKKLLLTTGSQENDNKVPDSDDLKAKNLIRDKGMTIENILKNYEQQIEALSKLTSQEKDSSSTIADLVTNYEKKIEDLKASNSVLEKNMGILAEKIGKDLVKALEGELGSDEERDGYRDSGQQQEDRSRSRWKAFQKIKEDEKTLADIIENYEDDLERLKREKSAMEALLNNEKDGQSALDVISQYEDEIHCLKDTNKEKENKLSTLIARIGDNLATDILTLPQGKGPMGSCSLEALRVMALHGKQLFAVLIDYEDDLMKLTRENETLKAVASKDEVGGKTVTSFVSEYEDKIQKLIKEKNDSEFSLRMLTEKIGEPLVNEITNTCNEDKPTSVNAVKIMKDESKSLANVIEKYENELAKLGAIRDLATEDPETKSFIEKISEYEDEISLLTRKIKEQTLLEKKVGIEFSKQLTALAKCGTGESKEAVSLKAVAIMEREKESTVADVLKEYETDLENKNHEISVLKELISSDMLEIAASQESEIHELKKVKEILANELDVITDKVGKELVRELLKKSSGQPELEKDKLYRDVVEKMNKDGKPLESVIEEYDQEIKLMMSKNEELSRKEGLLTAKIGERLIVELLSPDVSYNSTDVETKPLFVASEVMLTEKKTLAEVVLDYEEEIAKLKRENGALRVFTEESSQDTSVIDAITNYEEQIEKIGGEQRELMNRLHKITHRVGVGLTKELLKLPDDVCESKPEATNQLTALTLLKESNFSLTDVLRMYETKLRGGDEVDLGPLVSGNVMTDDIKFAHLVRLESEPQAIISEEGNSEIFRYLQGNEFGGAIPRDGNALNIALSQEHDQMKMLEKINAVLSEKFEQLSRKVGKELSQALMRSPEDKEQEGEAAITTAEDLDAFDDINKERATIAEVLESYERRLKGPSQSDVGTLGNGHVKEEEIKPARSVRANEIVEEICDINDTEIVSHYKALNEEDASEVPELWDMDIAYLVEVVEHPGESVLPIPDKDVIHEEVTKVELPQHERNLSSENLEELFDREFPVENKGGTKLTENKAVEGETMGTLERRIMELERELETQKLLKEKYEKDVHDLLKDIVDLKMQQVDGDSKNLEETRREIQEEVDLKQDNKRLHEELEDEKQRRLSMEKIKGDLSEKLDSLIKENELLRKKQSDAQNVSENERAEEICHIGETEMASDYNISQIDLDQNDEKETDSRAFTESNDLELISLQRLIPESPVSIEHPVELLVDTERHPLEDKVIKVELPEYMDTLNPDFVKSLLGNDFPLDDSGNVCEISDSKTTESKGEFRGGEKLETFEKKIKELEQELRNEKRLKEKYEKDIQDLLQDIVDLKMKQAENDEESPAETRTKIQEDVDLRLNNKRLQEDLAKERKRRLSIEESKRDLLDEVDTLMREREVFLQQQNETKMDGKLVEEMISLRKKIGELVTKNKNLNKEVEELRESIKEMEVCHEEEKSRLLMNFETEKSAMMDELVTSKSELENQLQELLAMNDDLKRTIKSLLEELKESNEKLVTEGEKHDKKLCEEIKQHHAEQVGAALLEEVEEKDTNAAHERMKTGNLKEQLDETENALQQTLKRYQGEITSLETERVKSDDELRQEIEILRNKLELSKDSAEQQRKDFENVLAKEKERIKDELELELAREKRRLKLDFEDREDTYGREIKKHSTDLQEQEEKWNKEREEMQELFRVEKEKLQKAFDEELRSKMAEKEEQNRRSNEQINREFEKEKMEIKATIEKKIYEQLIDKNIAAETDFRDVLSKILQEHSKEIEGVEDDIRKAEERFQKDRNRLIEQTDKEKEALKKTHEEEKRALESAVQNLLKEVVKLKHQRKEMRMIHKKEKESLEEIYERDRVKLKEDWDRYKEDLLRKVQGEFDCKLENETTKLETRLEDMKREMQKSAQRAQELEAILRGIPRENEQRVSDGDYSQGIVVKESEEQLKEIKSAKKKLEEEYEKKLKAEKRRFEDTLQALRREIGSLQEKRRLIQDKLYNHDPSVVDRHVMEKSLANFKMEMLSKMEEEVSQKIVREKKPLEETIRELQDENEELKRQRWELRNQLRRERSKLEEQFEQEREKMERQFLKEKEELKNKLEVRIQREMTKRTLEEKVTRALSPSSNVSFMKLIENCKAPMHC